MKGHRIYGESNHQSPPKPFYRPQGTPQTQALNYSGTKKRPALEESAGRWHPGEFGTATGWKNFIEFFRGLEGP